MYLFATSNRICFFFIFSVVLLQDNLQQVPHVTVVIVMITIGRGCRSNKRNKHRWDDRWESEVTGKWLRSRMWVFLRSAACVWSLITLIIFINVLKSVCHDLHWLSFTRKLTHTHNFGQVSSVSHHTVEDQNSTPAAIISTTVRVCVCVCVCV